jgi:hypothetical protein
VEDGAVVCVVLFGGLGGGGGLHCGVIGTYSMMGRQVHGGHQPGLIGCLAVDLIGCAIIGA